MSLKRAWGRGSLMALALATLVPAVHAEGTSSAQAVESHEDQFLSLTTENDKYFGNSDRHYTNGAKIEYTRVHNGAPSWVEKTGEVLPFLNTDGDKVAGTFSINHAIFTPDHAESPTPNREDIPYSGYLFTNLGFTNMKGDVWDSYTATVGMVGPSAQGKYVQRAFHDFFNFYKPAGWDAYHLSDEPVLNVSYLRRHRNAWNDSYNMFGNDWFVELEPRYGFAAGNAYTYATSGATLRFGPEAAKGQDEVSYMVPGMPGTGIFTKAPQFLSWYGFVGVDARLMARNIFLDGNTFKDNGAHVTKNVLVGNATAGVAVTAGKYRATVSINQMSKEYKDQPASDVFGQLTLGYRF
jgi:lipid A 3-O-deacylase